MNILDDKKQVVVTTPFLERKLLTTEKVTTSDRVNKRTEKITTSEDIDKGTDEAHKHTENTTTSEQVDKGSETFEDTKESVFTIRRKDSDKFEGQSKGYTGWLNPDHEFLKIRFSTLEPDFNNIFMKWILKVQT